MTTVALSKDLRTCAKLKMSENGKDVYTKPPNFITDRTSFRQYKRDVERWVHCTSIDKKLLGDIILLNIPANHPLKERLENEVGEEIIDNEDGVDLILDAVEAVYGSDEVLESYLLFRQLELKNGWAGYY